MNDLLCDRATVTVIDGDDAIVVVGEIPFRLVDLPRDVTSGTEIAFAAQIVGPRALRVTSFQRLQ